MSLIFTIIKHSSVVASKTKHSLLGLFVYTLVQCTPSILFADSPVFFSQTYIDHQKGLPQSSVRSVLIDHDGFLWAGTENGLARYDGNRFIDFSKIISDIPRDVSLGLQIDSQNRIWNSWYKHSLRVLLADRNSVIVIEPAKGFPNDLSALGTPKVVGQSNGDVWFPGRSNIYRINTKNIITSLPIDSQINSNGIAVGNQVVFGTLGGLLLLNTDTENIEYVDVSVLAGSSTQHTGATIAVTIYDNHLIFCRPTGVFSYALQTKELVLSHAATDFMIEACKPLESNLLIGLGKPLSGRIKLATLDMRSKSIVPNRAGLPEAVNTRYAAGLHDTFVDSHNHHWVLLADVLFRSNSMESDFQPLEFPIMPFGIEDVFAQSHSGAVWLRTDGNGLARFSSFSRRFGTTVPPVSISDSSRIRYVATDQNDNVWLVNDEHRLLYWNRNDDTWVDQLPDNTEIIQGLEILPDGTVWIFLPPINKLLGFDPKTRKWEYEYQLTRPSSAFSQTVDGRLIIPSGNHIDLMNPKTGQTKRLTKEPLTGQIRAFEQDDVNNIWVGTHESGLIKVSPSGDTKYWTKENSGLTSNEIFSLHIDSDGLIWIGTWHGGLLSFDPSTGQFNHYGLNEGLPDSTVFGILEDENGYLWLSTYAGLVRFKRCINESPCRPEFIVFNRQDGLQGAEFDADSYFKSDRGELFFAGMGGLNAFYPETIPINQHPPAVVISRAQLNGRSLPGSNSEFTFPDKVRLPFDFGELRLEISILDFNDPEKNRMQYRDTRNGSTWEDMKQASILIRGLNDGSHTLQFRGTNNDGVWSEDYAEITLIVSPPLFRHPLMLGLYLFMAILMPTLYFRKKQALLKKQKSNLIAEVKKRTHELEQAHSSRERFFTNVSHEICSPVHMILLMLENHLHTASDEDRTLYKSATGYAAQLMVYLKQLVREARSFETDNHLYSGRLDQIIDTMVVSNQPIARARSVFIEVSRLPPERVALYPSSTIGIFSNLLCNALAYTPENGVIEISGLVIGNYYKLTITHTISVYRATDINRLIAHDAEGKLNAGYFGGHGLGLSIVKSAVEILRGRLDADLKDEQNVTLTVALPLANEAMQNLPNQVDLGFSHEQMLAVKLLVDEEEDKPQAVTEMPFKSVSVLVVEEDAQIAGLVSKALSQDFKIYVANTAKDGLRQIRKHPPDAILCELYLPDQPGFELLRAVRSNRMTMDIFFVMVTTSVSEADRLKCQELGVDQFVQKPMSSENFKLLINNHFDLSRQRAANIKKGELTRKANIDNARNTHFSFEENFAGTLEELYQDPDTSIADIQSHMSMGYAALMRNCKNFFEKTPKRLLIEKRVSVAKELLASNRHNVGAISELVGFSTQSQFAIVFKKETGITPMAFRKSNQMHR